MDCCSLQASLAVENYAHRSTDRSRCQTQMTIDTLPEDALIYVFDFYLDQASEIEAWHTLVHVCRRWRNLVFESSRRLNLRIACTGETPVTEKLDIWPPLPIVISDFSDSKTATTRDNIKAALGHHDRVCKIALWIRFNHWKQDDIIAPLEKPFPILTDLELSAPSFSPTVWPFDPDLSKFLGGSAQLQSLTLSGIEEIPDLLDLLLSTPNLVILRLDCSGSCQPDEVVPVLSALTRLEKLDLQVTPLFIRRFEDLYLPPLTRTALPSLTELEVRGDTGYVEDFMAHIDTPLLDDLLISLSFSPLGGGVFLNTPQLHRFISRIPKLQAPAEAHIEPVKMLTAFSDDPGTLMIFFYFSKQIFFRVLGLKVYCASPAWDFPSLAHFCRSAPFPLHPLKSLYIGLSELSKNLHFMKSTYRWLEFLGPFTAVKNLYLTKEFALHVAHALQELVGERVMEVLPILENVLIEEFQPSGPVHEVINEFVAARQLAGHLITISYLDIETLSERFSNEYND